MLRYQQYIELVRTQSTPKLLEAIAHAKKYIIPYRDVYPRDVNQAAGLLAFPPDLSGRATASSWPYAELYSPTRWTQLADIFVSTHNHLLALPTFPLLHTALYSGLSALKTPACHGSQSNRPSRSTSLTPAASVCPICSTELNSLARWVPYAHHSKSHVEHDLVLLPNGRVYGKARLEEYAAKIADLPAGFVKDLVTGEVYAWTGVKKVFIT
jgi:macrophage erythroblast attacher